MIVVVGFIVPVFVGIFEEIAADYPAASTELPLMTQITVGVSDLITGKWYIADPGRSRSPIYVFLRWKKTERGRMQWDRFKLKIPFKIGDVVQKVALARWSRTFSGTIASGVPILQAIKIAGETAGNAVDRGGDGRRLRVGQARRLDREAARGEHASSRRWSPTWSRSARNRASSRRCSTRSPTSTRPRSTPRSRR